MTGPQTLGLEAMVAHLEMGGAALLPTDTLPALAARPAHAAQIWARKRRPADKPLILMGSDLSQLVTTLGVAWRPEWLDQARKCWPGAVTLVLPIQGAVTAALHPGGRSLGLRVPSCSSIRELLERSGPLATTSVNRSGEPAAVTADEATARFSDLPLLAPLPWPAPSGIASTVVVWRSGGGWEILRRGAVAPPTAARGE